MFSFLFDNDKSLIMMTYENEHSEQNVWWNINALIMIMINENEHSKQNVWQTKNL